MTFISITRLRIRSLRFLPLFAFDTLKTLRQVRKAPGFLDGSLLPDRQKTFWTMTAWDSKESMRAYMTAGAHKVAMPKLMRWCDEASVVHWEQDHTTLPTWDDANARMRADGRPSKVRHPSPAHASMRYREPRTTGAAPIQRATG